MVCDQSFDDWFWGFICLSSMKGMVAKRGSYSCRHLLLFLKRLPVNKKPRFFVGSVSSQERKSSNLRREGRSALEHVV